MTMLSSMKFLNKSFLNQKRSFGSRLNQKLESFRDKPDPHLIKHDYIGPPDNESNLRPFVRCIPKNETYLAKQLREKRIEVEEWNQSFWSRHNKRFFEEKQDFIRLHNLSGTQDISADKMSEFYKSFLDKNKKVHILYNMSWYLKNLEVLILAFQVAIQNLFKRLKNKIN